jgi:hypothetical protein
MGEELRGWVETDDVADCGGDDGGLAAEGDGFVVGLRDDHAALVVSFVPGLGRGGEGEGEDGGEEEKEVRAEHGDVLETVSGVDNGG